MSSDLHDENNEIEKEKINTDKETEVEDTVYDDLESKQSDNVEGNKKKSDKRSRTLKVFSITSIFIAIAIVIGLNLIFDSTIGEKLQWDMTSTQIYSIGDTTKEILADLQKDVEIIGLFSLDESMKSAQYYSDIIPMLEDYERNSNGRVTLSYIDSMANPAIIESQENGLDPNKTLGIGPGDFAVRCGKKVRRISLSSCFPEDQNGQRSNSTEMNFSGAIMSVISDESYKAYFVTNHNENSYEKITPLLTANNFEVEAINTTALEEIPDDCSLLIYNHPKMDLSELETDSLMKYMQEQGGKLMVIAGFDDGQLIKLPNLNEVLNFMNLDLSEAIIAESDESYVISQEYPFLGHMMNVSSSFRVGNSGPLMSFTRAIMEYNNPKNYITVSPILTSSDKAYFLEVTNTESADEHTTTQLSGGMFSENNGWSKQSKAAVFGSTAMTGDSYYLQYSSASPNAQIFRKTVLTLVGASDPYLPIQPKTPPSNVLTKMPTATESTLMTLVFIILLPCTFIVVAIVVYNKRKKL